MDDETMQGIEVDRDNGYSTAEIEQARQQQAAAMLGGIGYQSALNSPYKRSDYEVRAACLEAATRVAKEPGDVLPNAEAFYKFLSAATA